MLHLASLGWRSQDIAETSGYTVFWIRKLVRRYNEGGPEALEDGRHHNPGQPLLLSPEQEPALDRHLRTSKPPDGGLWTGAKVAHWMRETLHRPVAEADQEAQEGFQAGRLPELLRAEEAAHPEAEVELWAMDEHRVGLKPILRRVWTPAEVEGVLEDRCVHLTEMPDVIPAHTLFHEWPLGHQ